MSGGKYTKKKPVIFIIALIIIISFIASVFFISANVNQQTSVKQQISNSLNEDEQKESIKTSNSLNEDEQKESIKGTENVAKAQEKIFQKPNKLKNYKFPKVKIVRGHGKIAFIIDDCGYSYNEAENLAKINIPLTFSVIPYLTASKAVISLAHSNGKQVMLHLPMEAIGNCSAEKITIKATMTDKQIQQLIMNAIAATPELVGINNHQGSKATQSKRVMKIVMKTVKQYGKLFFIDSKTVPNSVVCNVATECGVPTSENGIFLDNSTNVEKIKTMIRKAINMAQEYGCIIAIGHARPHTVQAFKEMLNEIEESGIQVVFASDLVK